MFYSASTNGFYTPEVHGGNVPGDVVEITEQAHAELLAGQSAGKVIVPNSDGNPVLAEPPPPPPISVDERIGKLSAAVQRHLDVKAQSFGYDSIAAAVGYADEPAVARFQNEGRALRAWRSLVWAACYDLLERYRAGEADEPTAAELIATLPDFDLPG
jgi:hypothetical protein